MFEIAKISKLKETGQDVTESTLEVITSLLLDNFPELGHYAAKIVGNEEFGTIIQTLTGGILGAIAPALWGVTLNFQQKRFERNVTKTLETIVQKQATIEQRLNILEPTICQKFIDGPYRDVLLDNIISENQEQKVQDNINGFINLMGIENPNDNIIFTFFNTLSQMNELDIHVLRLYQYKLGSEFTNQETYLDVIRSEGIDELQYKFIQEKLSRLGMLDSKNEDRRDENLDTIGKTLTDLIKQLYSQKPKEVKPPKLKRISKIESYYITPLGKQYLNFIEDPI